LSIANKGPELPEELSPAAERQSWRAFERIFKVIRNRVWEKYSTTEYRAWLARYPQGARSIHFF
jgi:hypothetical protein